MLTHRVLLLALFPFAAAACSVPSAPATPDRPVFNLSAPGHRPHPGH